MASAHPSHEEGGAGRPTKNLVGGGSALYEALLGSVCGFVFGAVAPIVGHPLDTIKSRMQVNTTSGSAWSVGRSVVKSEGFTGLYRGLLPPLVGSSIFRSVQLTTYAGAYAGTSDVPLLTTPLPLLGDLQPRVLLAGVFAGTVRTLIETPLEYLKVRRQTGGALPSWSAAARSPLSTLSTLYRTGFGVMWARTSGVLMVFFSLVDSMERHTPALVATPLLGPFLKGSVAATAAWVAVWPLEVVKTQMQGGVGEVGGSTRARAAALWREGGVRAFYRGVGPGALRGLIAKGCSMLAFTYCSTTLRMLTEGKKVDTLR